MDKRNKPTKNSNTFQKKLLELSAQRFQIENEISRAAKSPEIQAYYEAIAEVDEVLDIILL